MEKVLVTGAAGFIGGRVLERLCRQPGLEVLAGVRGWKGCARVARLGIRLVRCDVTDESSVREAMTGVGRVVHCAMSDGTSIVEGTRLVLSCASKAGVAKVVCLSTGDVYSAGEGSVDETSARDRVGDWYADAKRDAEIDCLLWSDRGLKISWLRPGIVYGPFCYAWTQRIGLRIAAGQVRRLQATENGICNAVFVDDVVEATLELMQPGVGDGEGFNINGPAKITWNDYLDGLASALGVDRPVDLGEGRTGLKSVLLEPARQAARTALKHFQGPIMALYTRNRLANRVMRKFEGLLKATPETREMRVYARRTYFVDGKIRKQFPEIPCTSLKDGLAVSASYLRTFGLVE